MLKPSLRTANRLRLAQEFLFTLNYSSKEGATVSRHKDAIALIKSLTGQANVLTIPRVFVDYTGSLDCALFLSQVVYWSDKGDSEGWFYKSAIEWKAELCLGTYEVRKATKHLIELGVLETKVKKANGAPTLHYRLKEAEFSKSILQFLQNPFYSFSKMDSLKSEQSITETTAEITQETTTDIYSSTPSPENEKSKPQKAIDPLQEHPAVIGLQARVDVRLTKRQLELVADTVDGRLGCDTFLMIVDKWIGKGYRQNDIEGMLQWFTNYLDTGASPWLYQNGNSNHNGRGKPQQATTPPKGRGWSGKPKELGQ